MDPPSRAGGPSQVRAAEPRDLPLLASLEAAADQTFLAVLGALDWDPPPTGQWRARQPGFLLVAEDQVVGADGVQVLGFAHVLRIEGTAHLEQLAVHPDHHRRGHGSALLAAVLDRAREDGHRALTLSTFADVPWNAPYYRRRGFVEVERPGPLLRRIQEKEQAMGLMRHGPRVVMSIALR